MLRIRYYEEVNIANSQFKRERWMLRIRNVREGCGCYEFVM